MPIFEITSFRGGLSDYDDKGIPGAFKFGTNLDIRKQIDSLSCNQTLVDEGLDSVHSPSASISPSSSVSRTSSLSPSATPSPTPSPTPSSSPSISPSLSPSITKSYSNSPSPSPSAGLTTVFRGLIHFFVKCSDGYTYGFDDQGYIYRRDADGFWLQIYKDSNGAIKGAVEKPSPGRKTWMYWATNTVLKRKPLPGRADWNDAEVVNSNLEEADWHTMKQIGGALKIANRDMLALVGYDDSYTNEALDLIPGNISKTIVERNGRAIVGTYKTADPNKGINAAIDSEFPLAQIGDDGEIYFANMNNAMPSKRFPGGGKVNPDGVTTLIEDINFFEWEETALSWIDKQSIGNMALFAVYNADSGYNGIYSYGRKNKNHPFVLNLEYLTDDYDELGAITVVDGTILVSYQDGTEYGVLAVDSTTKAVGTYYGLDFKAPVKNPINITTWKYAELFMSPLPSGASVSFYYKMNKTGSWVQAYLANGTASYSVVSGKKAVFNIGAEGEIYEQKIVLTPTANSSAEIYRSRTYFI